MVQKQLILCLNQVQPVCPQTLRVKSYYSYDKMCEKGANNNRITAVKLHHTSDKTQSASMLVQTHNMSQD